MPSTRKPHPSQLPLLADDTPLDEGRDDRLRDTRRTQRINERRRVDAPVSDAGTIVERPALRVWVEPKPIVFTQAEFERLRAAAEQLEQVYCGLLPHCRNMADGWLDGTPACADCADAWLERDAVTWQNPYLVLPELEAPSTIPEARR